MPSCAISGAADTTTTDGGKVLVPSFSVVSYNTPFMVPSHLLRTSSYMNFFRIQCNFILYKYTHTYFFFHFSFILFIYFCILFFKFFFSCSGMFRVPDFINGRFCSVSATRSFLNKLFLCMRSLSTHDRRSCMLNPHSCSDDSRHHSKIKALSKQS